MFQPYDTTGDNAWLVEAITQFGKHHLDDLDMHGTALRDGLHPSSAENTRINLFGIKPFDWSQVLSDPAAAGEFPPCTVCNLPFQAGDTFDHST